MQQHFGMQLMAGGPEIFRIRGTEIIRHQQLEGAENLIRQELAQK